MVLCTRNVPYYIALNQAVCQNKKLKMAVIPIIIGEFYLRSKLTYSYVPVYKV